MDKSVSLQILEEFSEIRRHINILALKDLRPLGLGQKQAKILRILSLNPSCSLADLSRATLSDPAAVTRAIDSLEKADWLERKEHPSDRRRWVLSLSPSGRKKIRSLNEIVLKISDSLVKDLSPTETETLARLLKKVKVPMSALTEGQCEIDEED